MKSYSLSMFIVSILVLGIGTICHFNSMDRRIKWLKRIEKIQRDNMNLAFNKLYVMQTELDTLRTESVAKKPDAGS